MLSAIVLTFKEKDKAHRKDFWLRIIDFRRIRPVWILIIFVTVPLISILAALTYNIFSGQPNYPFYRSFDIIFETSHDIAISIGSFSFFGPLPEELGWRGFALDRLQARWNGVVSSMIFGSNCGRLAYSFVFSFREAIKMAFGFGTAGFWLYLVGVFPETIIMTWIFNNTKRSTLSAIFFHFMINFTGQFIDLTHGLAPYRLVWSSVVALVIILIVGRNLGKKQ